MTRVFIAIGCILTVATGAVLSQPDVLFSTALAKDKVIDYAGNDKAMNAAIAAARKSLPAFWKRFAKPAKDEVGFSIKVRISDGNFGEHFWTRDVEKNDDIIHAVIDNDPKNIKTVKKGQRIRVNSSDITDWMYWRGQKMHGAYTLRAMLPRIPKSQAEAFRVRLAPLP